MTTTTTTPFTTEQLTGSYTLDPSHSRIGFSARHAMVTKVRGAFNEAEGHLQIDAADPARSSAKVVVQTASIDTRNAERDAHLRSNDFFAMEEFPTIEFASTSTERIDDDHYRVTGDLTVRGVTRPVSVDFELVGAATDPWGNLRIGFEGTTTVNRKDFGLTWNTALETGGVLVSDKVTIELELSATKDA